MVNVFTQLATIGRWYYVVASSLVVAILILAIFLSFKKTSTQTHRQFKGLITTALWTCLALLFLVLFSSWQRLPTVGTPAVFWIVTGVMVIWLMAIGAWRLTVFQKRLKEEQQLSTYSAYLPKQK